MTEEKDDDDKEGRGEEGPAAHKVPIPMGDEKTKKLKTEVTEEKDNDDKEGRVEEAPAAHKVPIPMGDKTEYIKLKLVGQDSNEQGPTDLEYIKLKLVGQYSHEIHFMVKQTTQMGKLKKAYTERVGVPVTSLRFLLDGRRITDSEPVSALVKEMEANDVIGVYQEKYGCFL